MQYGIVGLSFPPDPALAGGNALAVDLLPYQHVRSPCSMFDSIRSQNHAALSADP